MAHNLSQFNGEVTMAYAGETPWHHLGNRLRSLQDVSAAIVAAGLNWTVAKQTLYLADGREVEDRKAIVRNEDQRILGTVGPRFTPIQNADAFGILQDVINKSGVTIEAAGALGNGSRTWMLAKFPNPGTVIPADGNRPADIVKRYFLLTQAHDGSAAYTARSTDIRVVCQNTLTAAIPNQRKGADITIRHTSSAAARLAEAEQLIKRLAGVMDETLKVYQNLATINVTADDVRAVINELFPIADDATPEVKTKTVAAQTQVGILFKHGKGSDLAGPTAWGLYNAVTEYVDHVRPAVVADKSKSEAAKARSWESAIFGNGNALKVNALASLRQLVAA